ncbi:MAG: hypothetical protein HYY95_13410 [Candidatus Rokubacteria bacterium]|nr:hypothetical protein [Candidatus Rokubacteria bacterium]
MAVSGPRVLELATGEQVSEEDLGGWQVHAEETGFADAVGEDEAECLDLVRRFLSFMPSHAGQAPPRAAVPAGSGAEMAGIADLVPEARNRAYDMTKVLRRMADGGEVFPIRSCRTGAPRRCLHRPLRARSGPLLCHRQRALRLRRHAHALRPAGAARPHRDLAGGEPHERHGPLGGPARRLAVHVLCRGSGGAAHHRAARGTQGPVDAAGRRPPRRARRALGPPLRAPRAPARRLPHHARLGVVRPPPARRPAPVAPHPGAGGASLFGNGGRDRAATPPSRRRWQWQSHARSAKTRRYRMPGWTGSSRRWSRPPARAARSRWRIFGAAPRPR